MAVGRNIILQNIKNGDESSFKSVFEEFYGPLVTFANSYVLDRAEADDIVQSVFIKFWERSPMLEIDTSIDAYLFTCVKNTCLNKLKSLKIRDRNNLLLIEGLMSYYAENERVDLNLEKELAEAIQQLPEKMQEIIRLRYAGSKKIAEISNILSISENTVKTQLSRGKEKLRKHFRISGQTLSLLLLIFAERI